MNLERNLWVSLMVKLAEEDVFFQRIESDTANGIPDVWIGKDGAYAWVENKAVAKYPVRATTNVFGEKHGLRPEQKVWHLRAARHGVVSYIVAAVGSGHQREVFVVPGALAFSFNTLTRPALSAYACPLAAVPARLLAQPTSGA